MALTAAQYRRKVAALVKDLDKIEAATISELIGRTKALRSQIITGLAGQAGWNAHALPQMLTRVNTALQAWSSDTAASVGAGVEAAFGKGVELADNFMVAADVVFDATLIGPEHVAAMKTASSELVQQVSDSTRTKVNNEIRAAALGLQKPDEAIAAVARLVPGIWQPIRKGGGSVAGFAFAGPLARAETIVRTETNRAFNLATQTRLNANAERLEDVKAQKEWVATADPRTRGSHRAAHGQRRKRSSKFSVGGASLMFPGDPNGPAWEVINCRCTSIPVLPKWATSAPVKRTPLPKPKPKQPPTPKGPFGSPPSWASLDVARRQLSGGMHQKVTLTDANGDDWLFKPYGHKSGQAFRAEADRAAAVLAQRLGLPTAEVHAVTMPAGHAGFGKLSSGGGRSVSGSIQRVAPGVKGSLGKGAGVTHMEALTGAQRNAVQKEHVFDWLIGNHDGHGENMVILKGNKLQGIDKGQAFKFYGQDRLDIDYNPNSGFGEYSYYNTELERYAGGLAGDLELKGPKNNKALRDFLKAIDELPDEEFKAILRPYAEAAQRSSLGIRWGSARTADDFLELALRRKRSIRKDFGKLYDELEAKRLQALGITPGKKRPKIKGVVTPIDAKFAKGVKEGGMHGKSAYLADSSTVRSGEVLFNQFDNDGLGAELWLTPKGDAAIKGALGSSLPRAATTAAVNADEYWDGSLSAIKHLFFHLNPTSPGFDDLINAEKWAALRTHYAKLAHRAKLGDAGAQHHLDYWRGLLGVKGKTLPATRSAALDRRIRKNVKAQVASGEKLAQFDPPSAHTPTRATAGGASATTSETKEWNVDFSARGGLNVSPGKKAAFGGTSYDITIKGRPGIKIEYAHQGDANLESKNGRMRIRFEGASRPPKAADIQAVLDALGELGIDSTLATRIDMEALYLRKQGRVAKVSKQAAFKVPEGASSQQVVDKLSKAWSRKLGVEDVRKLPEYNPIPVHDWSTDAAEAAKGNTGNGPGRWFRFDVTDDQIDTANLDININLVGDPNSESFLKKALGGKSNALLANEQRQRVGILSAGGMSESADMQSGGARFMFTRLKPRADKIQIKSLRLDPKLMRDMDVQIYGADKYGRTSEFDSSHNGNGIEGLISASKGGSNELCVKHGCSLRYIQRIGVGGDAEKRRVMTLLRDAGVTKLGGMSIDKAVVVTSRGAGY